MVPSQQGSPIAPHGGLASPPPPALLLVISPFPPAPPEPKSRSFVVQPQARARPAIAWNTKRKLIAPIRMDLLLSRRWSAFRRRRSILRKCRSTMVRPVLYGVLYGVSRIIVT